MVESEMEAEADAEQLEEPRELELWRPPMAFDENGNVTATRHRSIVLTGRGREVKRRRARRGPHRQGGNRAHAAFVSSPNPKPNSRGTHALLPLVAAAHQARPLPDRSPAGARRHPPARATAPALRGNRPGARTPWPRLGPPHPAPLVPAPAVQRRLDPASKPRVPGSSGCTSEGSVLLLIELSFVSCITDVTSQQQRKSVMVEKARLLFVPTASFDLIT
ncbi:uncharacterized protein [Triticum aestivum]|uniref:uncharacterized protein n=1 Tax=Triticum aestivum TaxID=4565 RepID=UPI001D00CCD3|nr:uncharacterized protein LOC123077692 [Triticum aestivum]